MNGKIQVDRYLSVLLAILSLATLWLALDGKYYWHDIRFLYAASNFSLDEIMAGVFNPHQAWGHIDEISTAGFYTSKYLHIILIKGLLSMTADPGAAMQAGTYLSALLVTVTLRCRLPTVRQDTGIAPAGLVFRGQPVARTCDSLHGRQVSLGSTQPVSHGDCSPVDDEVTQIDRSTGCPAGQCGGCGPYDSWIHPA